MIIPTSSTKHIFLSIISRKGRNLHVARNIQEIREYYRNQVLPGSKKMGFVPTMGALHSGHLELMKKAKAENDVVVASVFVNPSQFSAGEDFEKYPRHLEKDIDMMKSVGVDCVFAPEILEMYPPKQLCHVEPTAFSAIYEGQARPEFFRGVATIVCKLFNIVQPRTSYFGQKDVSQCILIRRMVHDLNIPVQVKVIETIRDDRGLALSSRNAYLSHDEKQVASILYRGLMVGKAVIEASPSELIPSKFLKECIEHAIRSEPMVNRIEYVSIASYEDMKELEHVSMNESGAVISSAIRLGNVRLIDNLLVGRANELITAS